MSQENKDSQQQSQQIIDEIQESGLLPQEGEELHSTGPKLLGMPEDETAQRKEQRFYNMSYAFARTVVDGVNKEAKINRTTEEKNEYQERVERLKEKIGIDPLTGLLNRHGLDKAYNDITSDSMRRSSDKTAKQPPLGMVLFIDLDTFKSVNDTHGHAKGDAALIAVADALRDSLRGGDPCARIGGDEFVVLLPGLDSEEGFAVAEKLREAIREANIEAVPEGVTASIGVSKIHNQYDEFADVGDRADLAMLQAKQNGRDQVVAADDSLELSGPYSAN